MSTKHENLVKIGLVLSHIFDRKGQFLPIILKVAICYLIISGVNEPNVTKFIHNIQKSLPFNILNQNCDLSILFKTLVRQMKVG